MWDDELKIAREAAVKAGAAIMETYDWDLRNAEMDFKAVTLPVATLTVVSETITSIGD